MIPTASQGRAAGSEFVCHGAPSRPLPLTLSLSMLMVIRTAGGLDPTPFLLRVALLAAFLDVLILLISVFHHLLFGLLVRVSHLTALRNQEGRKPEKIWFHGYPLHLPKDTVQSVVKMS